MAVETHEARANEYLEASEMGAEYPDTDDELAYPSYQGCTGQPGCPTVSESDTDDELAYPSYHGCTGVLAEFPDTDDDLDYPSPRHRASRQIVSERRSEQIGFNDPADATLASGDFRSEARTQYDAAFMSSCYALPPSYGMVVGVPTYFAWRAYAPPVPPATAWTGTHPGLGWTMGPRTGLLARTEAETNESEISGRIAESLPSPLAAHAQNAPSSLALRAGSGRITSHADAWLSSTLRTITLTSADFSDDDDDFSDGEFSEFEDDGSEDSFSCIVEDEIGKLHVESFCSDLHEEVCTICLEDYDCGESVCLFPECRHVFHRECLVKWVKGNPKCPNCRRHLLSELKP